jgi:hypothetical protein
MRFLITKLFSASRRRRSASFAKESGTLDSLYLFLSFLACFG